MVVFLNVCFELEEFKCVFVLWLCTTDMNKLPSLPHALALALGPVSGLWAALILFTKPLEADENAVMLFERAAGLFCLNVVILCSPNLPSLSVFSVN